MIFHAFLSRVCCDKCFPFATLHVKCPVRHPAAARAWFTRPSKHELGHRTLGKSTLLPVCPSALRVSPFLSVSLHAFSPHTLCTYSVYTFCAHGLYSGASARRGLYAYKAQTVEKNETE